MNNIIQTSFNRSSWDTRDSSYCSNSIASTIQPNNYSVSLSKRSWAFFRLFFPVVIYMLRAFQNLKITQSVIFSVSILMMNLLAFFKFSSKTLFHKVTVFKNVFFTNSDAPIFSKEGAPTIPPRIIFSNIVIRIKNSLARTIAKIILISSQSPRVFFDEFSALAARYFHVENYIKKRAISQLRCGGLPL